MRKPLFMSVMLSFMLLAGCGAATLEASEASVQPEKVYASPTAYVSGMGCNDPSCTDATHHHDCPADCTEYDHYHNCGLDCTEAQHHHSQNHHQNVNDTGNKNANQPESQPDTSADVAADFVSGMGCSDPSCTDAAHHHDCPTDCTEYDHYHNCDLGCNETSHHHGGSTVTGSHGKHHENGHH